MDDVTQLLHRAALGSLDGADVPPVAVIRQRARRRGRRRALASVTLVLAMTVGGVVGLAGIGRASEFTGNGTVASAAQPAPAHGAR